MRILFINQYHVPQKYRGTEVNTHALAHTLITQGHEVAVAAELLPNGWLSYLCRAQIKLLRRPYSVDRVAGYPTYRAWFLARHLGAIAARLRPDVAVLQTTDPTFVEACATLPVPVVYYYHTVPDLPPPDHQRGRVLVNSLFNQRRARELFGLETRVVRPIVVPEHYRGPVDRREVTFFNLTLDKGVDIVLELARRLPDIPFRGYANQGKVRNPGDYAAQLTSLPNVTLSPPQRSGPNLYARSRIVLAPSRWEETWGRMASEAQVNEIPVLASDRGGLPEAVGEGGVILPVDAGLDAWTEALRRLWSDAAHYEAVRMAIRRRNEDPPTSPARVSAEFLAALGA